MSEPGRNGRSSEEVASEAGASEDVDGRISVSVNGENREIPSGLTVKGLLERLDLVPALVVVEYNREILDRGRYDEVALAEGDQLELVHFVGGG